jgi:hypothetical protein
MAWPLEEEAIPPPSAPPTQPPGRDEVDRITKLETRFFEPLVPIIDGKAPVRVETQFTALSSSPPDTLPFTALSSSPPGTLPGHFLRKMKKMFKIRGDFGTSSVLTRWPAKQDVSSTLRGENPYTRQVDDEDVPDGPEKGRDEVDSLVHCSQQWLDLSWAPLQTDSPIVKKGAVCTWAKDGCSADQHANH